MFKIFFFLTDSNDQYWLCVDTQNDTCNYTPPIANNSGVMSCSLSFDDNCQYTKHICCAITHDGQYWFCVCTHYNCKSNCTTFIADCSEHIMSCSISSDNNCHFNKSMFCDIIFSDHQWVSPCDMGPLSQTSTATNSKHLGHHTTTSIWHTIKTSTKTLIKTSATISYNPSHLSSLSQTTSSSLYSSTLPIVDTSSPSTIIIISMTAVLMAFVILLISLLLAIIVLRRYGQFKPGR